MRPDLSEADGATRDPRGEAMELAIDGPRSAFAGGQRGGAENDDRGLHGFPWTRIMEK